MHRSLIDTIKVRNPYGILKSVRILPTQNTDTDT